MALVHASCVAIAGAGVLIAGAPGSGKSDLALRLIDRGARLVADDQVVVGRRKGRVLASAPQALRGLLEVRGLGILRLPPLTAAPLALVVALDEAAGERLPEPHQRRIAGIDLPMITLAPFAASAAARVRLAMVALAGGDTLAGTLTEPQR